MRQNGDWVNQTELATTLDITIRRVRQLIGCRILPEDRDGKWHLPTCSERYTIYTRKSERDLDNISYDVEQRAKQLHELLDKLVDAVNDKQRRALLPKAAALHQEVFETLVFIMSAWSKSERERALMLRLIDYDAREAFAPIWRAIRIVIGHERRLNPDLLRLGPGH